MGLMHVYKCNITNEIMVLGGMGDTTHFVNTESNSFITSRLSLLRACHRANILIIVNQILSLHLRPFATNNMAIDVLRHNGIGCTVRLVNLSCSRDNNPYSMP
jgi:hypothetical protein